MTNPSADKIPNSKGSFDKENILRSHLDYNLRTVILYEIYKNLEFLKLRFPLIKCASNWQKQNFMLKAIFYDKSKLLWQKRDLVAKQNHLLIILLIRGVLQKFCIAQPFSICGDFVVLKLHAYVTEGIASTHMKQQLMTRKITMAVTLAGVSKDKQ